MKIYFICLSPTPNAAKRILGGDYYAQVTIDALTGDVLRILSSD